jgi:SAM-dependent methyltransferase
MRITPTIKRLLGPLRGARTTGDGASGDLRVQLERFGTWSYPFDLGDGVATPLHVPWLAEAIETRTRILMPALDEQFESRWEQITCLDVACNEGFFSFEVARRGASDVLGFDARAINIEKAEFVRDRLGHENARFEVADLSDLTLERFGTFDLTLCLGLLYHLENPMDTLRRVRSVTREVCAIDTQVLKPSSAVRTAWITDDNVLETENVIGIIEEGDAAVNPTASVTGLSMVMNKTALMTMLRYAGFTDVKIIDPYPGCFQPYATGDRVIALAWV